MVGKTGTVVAVAGLLVCGSINTLAIKVAYSVKATGPGGNEELFVKPWFGTFVMFVAMACALPFDRDMRRCGRAPADDLKQSLLMDLVPDSTAAQAGATSSQAGWWRKVTMVSIPAVFDILATGLSSMGFVFLPASVYQLMRGAEMVFSALFSVVFLRRKLWGFHWLGVMLCMVGVFLVGLASVWGQADAGTDASADGGGHNMLLVGMSLALLGQVVQAGQVVAEEWLLVDMDLPGIQVVGFEGVWGVVVMLATVFPVLKLIPGSDHGCLEDDSSVVAMATSNNTIFAVMFVFWLSCGLYNVAGIAVTGALSAVHRVMLEAFRTSIVWVFGLGVHYLVDSASPYGESWTAYSWLELVGFGVLMVGQVVYGQMVKVPGLAYPAEEPTVVSMASPGHLKHLASPLPRA